jgi:hypothetical protein
LWRDLLSNSCPVNCEDREIYYVNLVAPCVITWYGQGQGQEVTREGETTVSWRGNCIDGHYKPTHILSFSHFLNSSYYPTNTQFLHGPQTLWTHRSIHTCHECNALNQEELFCAIPLLPRFSPHSQQLTTTQMALKLVHVPSWVTLVYFPLILTKVLG